MSEEEDLKKYVNQRYLAILGRPADPSGLAHYVEEIQDEVITKDGLDNVLRGSDEYRDRVHSVRSDVDITNFVKRAYIRILKRPVDIGALTHYVKEIQEGRRTKEDIEDILKQSDEYKSERFVKDAYMRILKRLADPDGLTHYAKELEEGRMTEDDVVRILKESGEYKSIPESKVAFCQGTYGERVEQTLRCLERVALGVDCCIIIVDDTVTAEQVDQMKAIDPAKVKVVHKPWEDDFPKMRNAYLEEARKAGATFVCVSDPDELYDELFVSDIKGIVSGAERENIALFLINSHDVTIDEKGGEREVISSFFKNLMFRLCDKVRYEGVADGSVHEVLTICDGSTRTLPSRYFYQHFKQPVDVKERGARNIWISGGGNNAMDKNPHFAPLRAITDRLALKLWKDVRAYVRQGNVAKELLDWIISIKDVSGADYINETRDWFLWYSLLHPAELEGVQSNPQPLPLGSHDEVMAFVEREYLRIIGSHAEDEGKKQYTEAILAGEIKREDFEVILKESEEYKERK